MKSFIDTDENFSKDICQNELVIILINNIYDNNNDNNDNDNNNK